MDSLGQAQVWIFYLDILIFDMVIGQGQISFETFGHDICSGDDCVGGEGERDEGQGGGDELGHNICQIQCEKCQPIL